MAFADRLREAAGSAVRDGPELRRILALPRRGDAPEPPEDFGSEWFRAEGCGDSECPYGQGLLGVQRRALYEASRTGGLFAPVGTGFGKTLLSFLLPTVLKAERPTVLILPKLRVQTTQAYEHLKKHWRLHPSIQFVAYSDLSNRRKADVLERLNPDLVIADEGHRLKNSGAACTKRFKRAHRALGFKYVDLSGTPLQKSVREVAHRIAFALGAGSPYPLDYVTMDAWAWALDDLPINSPPGALLAFGRDYKAGFRDWVLDTPGVIATSEVSCAAPLVIARRPLEIPPVVEAALAELRRTWSRPDGEFLTSPLEFSRYARQLSQGFYLRWTEVPPREWLEARRAWHSEVRLLLGRSSRPGFDSSRLVEDAAAVGRYTSTAYGPWAAVRASFRPETEAVWLDDFLAKDAAAWALEAPGIVWVRHPAMGRRVAELAGLEYYGEGKKAESSVLDLAEGPERGRASFVASMDAHGTGRNFQAWSRALFTSVSSSGEIWEQSLSRSHRTGQRAVQVSAWTYLSTPETRSAFAAARRNARFIEGQFGQRQRLTTATFRGTDLDAP